MRCTNCLFVFLVVLIGCTSTNMPTCDSTLIQKPVPASFTSPPAPPLPAVPLTTLTLTNISSIHRDIFAYSTDFSASLGDVHLESTGQINIRSLTVSSRGNVLATKAVLPIALWLERDNKIEATGFLYHLPLSGEAKIPLSAPFKLHDGKADLHLGCSIVGGVGQEVQLFITNLEADDGKTGALVLANNSFDNPFPLPLTKFSVTSGSVKQTLTFGPTANMITAGMANQTLLCTDLMAYGEDALLASVQVDLELNDGLTMGDLSNLIVQDENNNQEILKITGFPTTVSVNQPLELNMFRFRRICLIGDVAAGAAGTMRPSFRAVKAQGLISQRDPLPIVFSAPPLQIDNPVLTVR